MITYVSEQIYVFLATLYGGIIIGFIYDLYRIFRGVFKPKKIATMIEDFIFWMLIGMAAVFVLLFSNDGQIRLYTFLGFVLGATLYYKILSGFVIYLLVKIIKIIQKIFVKILKIILYPINKLIKWIKRPCRVIKKRVSFVGYKIKRVASLPKRVYKECKKYIKWMRRKK
ncbi:spore cortex biosynthesis protein YabQ [Anaerophilus nitritogenes]|uniref:spore cortex biosynthesis protein YabQ n=1 Tax=Anaerophilus nitritogenes TaxID=2498136 RepID=UPI00101BEC7F|nr:spore cortex biosynthesis protein YabQ [Anaerophilus nitritogenes]